MIAVFWGEGVQDRRYRPAEGALSGRDRRDRPSAAAGLLDALFTRTSSAMKASAPNRQPAGLTGSRCARNRAMELRRTTDRIRWSSAHPAAATTAPPPAQLVVGTGQRRGNIKPPKVRTSSRCISEALAGRAGSCHHRATRIDGSSCGRARVLRGRLDQAPTRTQWQFRRRC
jgi:hypothetical protein